LDLADEAERPVLRWTPIISSRPQTESDEVDEGTFMTLENGDVEESGRMMHFETGRVEDYVEVWRRYPQETSAGSYVLERDDGLAFLGQIGERALGIARLGEGVAAWRDRMVDGEWKRFYAFGAGKEEIEKILPRLPGTIPAYWKEGETAKLGESRWTVRVIGRP
jgi:hypothetical protein